VENQELVSKLENEIKELTTKQRFLAEQLLHAESIKWELGYRCRDLAEDIWRLKVQLRNSGAVDNSKIPLLTPRTALEIALEKEIQDLKQRGKKVAGVRPRSQNNVGCSQVGKEAPATRLARHRPIVAAEGSSQSITSTQGHQIGPSQFGPALGTNQTQAEGSAL
jgi:hypothetical protein